MCIRDRFSIPVGGAADGNRELLDEAAGYRRYQMGISQVAHDLKFRHGIFQLERGEALALALRYNAPLRAAPALFEQPAAFAEEECAAAMGKGPAIAAGCGPERRPYHVILTSSSGTYQAWQCRMMYHHYQLQRSRDPCGEMGGLTRLLTSHNGQPDAFADEIPTFVVEEKKSSMGYVVVNRPHSMVQFVEHPRFREVVKEDYVRDRRRRRAIRRRAIRRRAIRRRAIRRPMVQPLTYPPSPSSSTPSPSGTRSSTTARRRRSRWPTEW